MYCFNLCGKYDPPSKVACPVIYLSTVKMPKNEKRKEKKKEYSAPKRFAEFSDTILLSCKCPRIFLYAPIEDKTSRKKKQNRTICIQIFQISIDKDSASYNNPPSFVYSFKAKRNKSNAKCRPTFKRFAAAANSRKRRLAATE